VEQVIDVSGNDLEITEAIVPVALANQATAGAAHLTGVAKMDGQMILVLDGPALMSSVEKSYLSETLADGKSRLAYYSNSGETGCI
jgi:hypothetical protein